MADRSAQDDTALWLGYPDLEVAWPAVRAVLCYAPAWDRRITQAYGTVPPGIRGVVMLEDGRALPARHTVDELRDAWRAWKARQVS